MNRRQKIGDQPTQEGNYTSPKITPTRTRTPSVIIVRFALIVLALGGSVGFIKGTTAKTVRAAGALVYTVDPNTANGGVFARSGPHTEDTQRMVGYGVYPNQQVLLLCGVTDGTPVGPYQNKTWHYVTDVSNPGEGNFWLSDHYVLSPNVANQLAPGESTCPNESSNPMQAPGSLPCTPILIIGVRGSGQPYEQDAGGTSGFGPTLTNIASTLEAYYGNNVVTAYGLPYPAMDANVQTTIQSGGPYFDSVNQGEGLLIGIIMQQTNACPQQVIELAGYSQGAQVVNDVVSNISPALRSHIGGVVTFGDPRFNVHNSEDRGTFDPGYDGLLGGRPELPQDIVGEVQSYCDWGDAICNTDRLSIAEGNYGHYQYQGDDSIQAAFFLELLHPKSNL